MAWYLHCWVQEQQQERRRGWVSQTGCCSPGHSGRSLAPGCSPGDRGAVINRICSRIVIPWLSGRHHSRFQTTFTVVPWIPKFSRIPFHHIILYEVFPVPIFLMFFLLKTMLLVLYSLVFSRFPLFLYCIGSCFHLFPVPNSVRFPICPPKLFPVSHIGSEWPKVSKKY